MWPHFSETPLVASAGQCEDVARRVVRPSVALGNMSFLTDTDMFTYYIVCRWASHSPDRALSCFTWKLHLAPAFKLPRLLKHKVLSPQGIVVLVFYSGWFRLPSVLPRLSNGSDGCVSSTDVLETSIPLSVSVSRTILVFQVSTQEGIYVN